MLRKHEIRNNNKGFEFCGVRVEKKIKTAGGDTGLGKIGA
jgi:hypothetical protein